jgi:hypothetical protein
MPGCSFRWLREWRIPAPNNPASSDQARTRSLTSTNADTSSLVVGWAQRSTGAIAVVMSEAV